MYYYNNYNDYDIRRHVGELVNTDRSSMSHSFNIFLRYKV